MRKLFKNISLISLILLTSNAFSKTPRAVVTGVKGNVFKTTDGKTQKIDLGDYLYDFDEVFTEVGGQLSFNDYFDHSFHLSGGGHLSVLNKLLELRNGYLWVQGQQRTDSAFHVQTINATASYIEGEFVISYDTENGKTQLLSVKGTHEFKNNNHEFLKESISKGKFSFITEKYNNGAPRVPTPIGVSAYTSVLSLYDGVKPLEDKRETTEHIKKSPLRDMMPSKGRHIASVDTDEKTGGKVIVIKKKRSVSGDRSNSLINSYESKVSKLSKEYKKKPYKFKPSYAKKSGVKISIFNSGKRAPASTKVKDSKSVRKPASVVRRPASMADLSPQVEVKKSAFESSLIKEYKKQMRHSSEVNSLIKELKNYDQDYKESY